MRVRRTGRGNSASQDDTHRAQKWPGCSGVWGLPLRFYFVGFWLGVHRVRDPAVYSAQGSVGGSTKAQLGPVSSLSRLQKELLAVGQPPCACPPRAPGRQRGGGEAGDKQPRACGLPEPPTQGGQRLLQRQVTMEKWGLPFLHHLPLTPKGPQIAGPPLPVPPQPCCSSIWPAGYPLLNESSGLPPTMWLLPLCHPCSVECVQASSPHSHSPCPSSSALRRAPTSLSVALHVS